MIIECKTISGFYNSNIHERQLKINYVIHRTYKTRGFKHAKEKKECKKPT